MQAESDIHKEHILIERLKQGERPAFDALVEMYREKAFAIAYNLVGNPEDAKDVLQEAFIKMYLCIKDFRGNARLFTWFYRILVNCSMDFLRKRKSRSKVFSLSIRDEEDKEIEVADARTEPFGVLGASEMSQHLDECLGGLSEKQRICFILKHENGLSNQEIAQVLHCALSTVKVHLFRAVKALRKKFAFYLAT